MIGTMESLGDHITNMARKIGMKRVLLVTVFACFTAGLPATSSAAEANVAQVDTVVVKWRPGVMDSETDVLPDALRAKIASALAIEISEIIVTRTGAFRFLLDRPLGIDETRAILHRLRSMPEVLYADLATQTTAASPATRPSRPDPPLDGLIVKYKSSALVASATRNEPLPSAELAEIGTLVGQPVQHDRGLAGGQYLLHLFQKLPRTQLEEIASRIEQLAGVRYAQPNYIDSFGVAPNDPCYPSNTSTSLCNSGDQWHYYNTAGGVNLPAAWNITTGRTGVAVAVIDTGALYNHPDLSGRFVGGYDFVSNSTSANDGGARDGDPNDPGDWATANECYTGSIARNSTWHGTHVAGTIAATSNNSTGVAGINWNGSVVPVRVLGKCGGTVVDISDGIVWAAGGNVAGVPSNTNPARVLNLSIFGHRDNATCDPTYQDAIDNALSRDAIVVVIAGNESTLGGEDSSYAAPGNCAGVITVAATGKVGERASYSNYGIQVEIAAPGGSGSYGVLSTLNSGTTTPNGTGYNYVQYFGTSMAAPHVSGIISLMLSVNPQLRAAHILSILQSTARTFPTGTGRDCTTSLCGAGIVDAGAAVGVARELRIQKVLTTILNGDD